MSTLTKAILVLVSFAVVATNAGCSKKGKSGTRAATPTAAQGPQDSGDDNGQDRDGDEHDGSQADVPATDAPTNEDGRYTVDDTAPGTDGVTTGDLNSGDGLDEVIKHPDVTNWEEGGRNKECGTAYRRKTNEWYPGLPNPPSEQRICTGGKLGEVTQEQLFSCNPGNGYIFTDSRKDGLMAMAVERFNRIPEGAQAGSRELSEKIRDFKVSADIYKTGNVKVQFALLVGAEKYETFTMKGRMRNWRGKTRVDVDLNKVDKAGLSFSGVLTCADLHVGCQNAIIRLQQHGRGGRVKRVAYVVHRNGDAHVTISDKDLNQFNQITNRSYREFAEFLSNTANNSCLAILGQVQTGVRQMPECAQRRLLAQCGRKQWQTPAAKYFNFRGWAVAYGRAGFEFEMVDQGGLSDFENRDNVRLVIRGPLVASSALPTWGRGLKVEGFGAAGIENVALVSNDGGGNLNLQVDFKGETKTFTRVSVTTLIEDTGYNADQMVQDAAQMPDLDGSQFDLGGDAPVERPEDVLRPPVEQGPSEGDLG